MNSDRLVRWMLLARLQIKEKRRLRKYALAIRAGEAKLRDELIAREQARHDMLLTENRRLRKMLDEVQIVAKSEKS